MADDPLDQAEEDVTATVGDVLDEVAAEFAASLADATELVAARFSVSRISRMFTGRMPRIVRRLLGVAEQGVDQAAADVDAAPPEGWDDLPARYDDGTLPEPMSAYVETTEHLLRAVGDRLAEVAREELAAGVDAGEDIDQLRDRLAARFAREGGQLGPGREQLISRTEAARAWNTGTLEVGRALTGPDRPIIKQWRTRRDPLVRDTHDAVDGQLRLLDEPFTVAGVSMQAPGDPTAPAAEVCNCRCRLVLEKAPAAASAAPAAPAVPWRDPAFTPEAAAILATWDNPFHRPRVPAQSQAASAGPAFESTVQAAAVEHTGAMIALLPTAEDAERLALDGDGAEPAEELHVTLWYLGEGAPWTEDQRNELIGNVRAEAANLAPFTANIFGANHWNPGSDSPSWVWAVGDNRDTPDDTPSLAEVQGAATYALENTHERPDVPTQHSPWSPHVCAIYSDEAWPLEPMTERVGEIRFDRIRVAFAGEHTDIPLGDRTAAMSTPAGDVSGADVRHHGRHDSTRNRGPGSAVDGNAHSGAGIYGAERLSAVGRDTVQGSPLGVDPRRQAGQRDPRSGSGSPGAADHGGRGRTPHLRDAEVRRGLTPPSPPVPGAQRPSRGEPGAGGVLRPSASVRPPGPGQGLGGMSGMPEGREPSVRLPQPGGPTEPEVQRGHPGQEEGVRQSAPQHAGVQGQGCCISEGSASKAQGRAGEPARHLRPPEGLGMETLMPADQTAAAPAVIADDAPAETRGWSTPDTAALAFEDVETGDGRLFAPGALSWDTGPLPLQYADEMLMGHQGAQLAGAINTVTRDGSRIAGTGVLYTTQPAGADALTLLEQEAPLGVSVDLDDVDVEFVDRTLDPEEDGWMFASARLPSASVLRMDDGSILLNTATAPAWTASGSAFSRTRTEVQLITDATGLVTAAAIRQAFGGHGVLTAAAGDADDPEAGIVVHSERAGDFLMRITRARLRGATLVAMPAYADARIVLDPIEETAAARPAPTILAASADTLERVIAYVTTCPAAVGPRTVSKALRVSMTTARNCLTSAARDGRLVRLAAGLYAAPCSLPEGLPVTAAAETPEHGVPAGMAELEASAWRTMQDADPMPAEWFREPTAEELPPGSGGVHYREGRVFGWVAQAGEPHAGFPGRRLTIESLGRIDLSHFLRARFALDDGNTVRVGAFTMNVPHNRDGAECNDEVCQFDDSRTVAGIVTVGMSKGGMWFSGAAAPWLSEWDRHVFNACQPSYHLKQARTGGKGWELRAVLSVPVPGHSSPLVATAVTERANLALAASAAYADIADSLSTDTVDTGDTVSTPGSVHAAGLPGQRQDTMSTDLDLDAVTAALLSDGNIVDRLVDALAERTAARQAERRAEIEALSASMALTPDEITASATPAAPQEGTH